MERTAVFLSVLLVSIVGEVWSQRLLWLGSAGGRSTDIRVSADGSVVVGVHNRTPFRWTQSGGMENLPIPPGTVDAWVEDISDDGSVAVGFADSIGVGPRPVRWLLSAGRVEVLGVPFPDSTIIGAVGWAYGTSANGSAMVGFVRFRNRYGFDLNLIAFRWTESDGMQLLDTLGSRDSKAYAVSANGSVVVGEEGEQACRWIIGGGIQILGTLAGGRGSSAYGVSADGSVVVGSSETVREGGSRPFHAFRWTASGGMQNLATSEWRESWPRAVSADGSIVVGGGLTSDGFYRAFRWTPSRGMENLNVAYASLLAGGAILLEAWDVTPDGRYIVGEGIHPPDDMGVQRNDVFLLDTQGSSSVSHETQPDLEIRVEPQPAMESGQVSLKSGTVHAVRVEVWDMLGRSVTVLADGLVQNGAPLTLPPLPSGMYMVVARAGQTVAAEPFVVVR